MATIRPSGSGRAVRGVNAIVRLHKRASGDQSLVPGHFCALAGDDQLEANSMTRTWWPAKWIGTE